MPHAVYAIAQASPGNFAPRQLIPGIAPGGSRAGQVTKPALLIKSAYAWIRNLGNATATADVHTLQIGLKLSQEPDLTPGLILPVTQVVASGPATAQQFSGIQVEQLGDKLGGRIFAPKYVGIRILEGGGTFDAYTFDVYLDYEMVDIPWMNWFILWDFLDNVQDDTWDY